MLASIINTLAGVRKQHLETALKKYSEQRNIFEEAIKRSDTQNERSKINIPMDLEVFPCLNLPISELQAVIHRDITLTGNDALLITPFVQVLTDLNHAILTRSKLVDDFSGREWANDQEQLFAYFAFRNADGNTDGMFKGALEAMDIHSKDGLAFARLVHDALVRRANQIRVALKDSSLKIPSIDFADLEKSIRFPDMSEYSEWGDQGH